MPRTIFLSSCTLPRSCSCTSPEQCVCARGFDLAKIQVVNMSTHKRFECVLQRKSVRDSAWWQPTLLGKKKKHLSKKPPFEQGHGATRASLTPDLKAGSSYLCTWSRLTEKRTLWITWKRMLSERLGLLPKYRFFCEGVSLLQETRPTRARPASAPCPPCCPSSPHDTPYYQMEEPSRQSSEENLPERKSRVSWFLSWTLMSCSDLSSSLVTRPKSVVQLPCTCATCWSVSFW